MPSSSDRSLCSVSWCEALRSGFGLYCDTHHQANLRNGDPQAKTIRKSQLQPYRKLATRFLKANSSHSGLLRLFAHFDYWLLEASKAEPRPRSTSWARSRIATRRTFELSRLHKAGVSGEKMFLAAATVALYGHYQPHKLPPFSIPYRFAIARSVLTLAPKEVRRTHSYDPALDRYVTKLSGPRLPAKVLDHLGIDLTKALLPLLEPMIAAIEASPLVTPTIGLVCAASGESRSRVYKRSSSWCPRGLGRKR